MRESREADLQVRFDRRVRLQFQGAKVTSDAGLLAAIELDEALGLTKLGGAYVGRYAHRAEQPARPGGVASAVGR